MGRQEGIIQLTGGVGNLSFYKSQDGYLVRKKSGVSGERIRSDPAYARTRENIAEFRRGALATKLLRTAFRSFIRTAADNRMTSRLTSAVMKVIKADAINSRGQRNVADGEVALLEGFEFNKNAGLTKTFGVPLTPSIDRATGTMIIDIPAFRPVSMISAPEGATHFRLKAVGAAIDFEDNTCSVGTSESADLPINQEVQGPLRLSQTVVPASVKPMFLAFGVEFLQLVNGAQYPLTNGTFNAMAIVRVDGLHRAELNTNEEDTEEKNITPLVVGITANRPPCPSKTNNLLQQQSLRQSPAMGIHIHRIHGGHELFVDLHSISATFAATGYPLTKDDFAGHVDDLYPRFDLPSSFKPRDG